MLGSSEESMKIVYSPDPVPGADSYTDGAHKAIYGGLAQLEELMKMEKYAFAQLAKEINDPNLNGLETKWYLWVRNVVSRAAADAVYGPDNPVKRDPSLIDRLW